LFLRAYKSVKKTLSDIHRSRSKSKKLETDSQEVEIKPISKDREIDIKPIPHDTKSIEKESEIAE